MGPCLLPFYARAWLGDQKSKRQYMAPPLCHALLSPLPGRSAIPTVCRRHMADSPAAVQPHVPAAQPGPVFLVLVGGEVLDDGRLPGLQRVGILVRAVPATQPRGAPGSVWGSLLGCECLPAHGAHKALTKQLLVPISWAQE